MGILTGKSLISKDVAKWQIERFAWLIETFCPKYGPLRASFQTIENDNFLVTPEQPRNAQSDAVWQDWAQDYLDAVKARIGMENWPLQLVLLEKSLPKRDLDKELHMMAHSNGHERYYTDEFGRPVIYAEPSKLSTPGYLMTRIALAISDLLHVSATKPEKISRDPHSVLTDLTAAFLGLGLIPVYARGYSRPAEDARPNIIDTFNRDPGAEQIFSCALFLAVKGYQAGQALAIHGGAFSKDGRVKLELAFEQLETFKVDIARLRSLAIMTDSKAGPQISLNPLAKKQA